MLRTSCFILLLGCVALAGCANYQLGTGGTQKVSKLFIAPIGSDALIPQAQALVTTQLREAFIKDGRVELVESADEADAVLKVTLSAYNREVGVVRADDTGLARRYDVTLHGRATLTTKPEGRALFENRELLARKGVFTDSGQVPAEYQTLPLLAEKLASEAVRAVLDTW
jgi:hypothetical protein